MKKIITAFALFLSSIAFAEAAPDPHQNSAWVGQLETWPDNKKMVVSVIHRLRENVLPETNGWVELKSPLKIALFKKNAIKYVTATRYNNESGCDVYPTYEIESKENLNPKDWYFAAPENNVASWAEDNMTFAKSHSPAFKLGDLPDYEWERLYDKISFLALPDQKMTEKQELLKQIRQQAKRQLSGLRTEKFVSLLFVDVEFNSKGKKYSIHRAYHPSKTGGFDEIPTPYASGSFWDESYSPTQAFYMNTKRQTNLVLRIQDTVRRSLFFITNFHGFPLEHHFEIPESCE